MNILDIRRQIKTDVFDYLQLVSTLGEYSNIRNKIGRLLEKGEIIQIKKGLYTFADTLRKDIIDPAMVANILYGPSYVSTDYALSAYGVIPESVTVVTSVTLKRSHSYHTPIGNFYYQQNSNLDYSIGILQKNGTLFASLEKAIYDKIVLDKRTVVKDVETYLFKDLRFEPSCIQNLNQNLLHELSNYAPARVQKIITFLRHL